MTNEQLYLAIGIPVFANALMFSLLMLYVSRGLDTHSRSIDTLRSELLRALDALRADVAEIKAKLDTHSERIARLEERTGPITRPR